MFSQILRDTKAIGNAESGGAGPRLHEQTVSMAVVATFELENLISPCISPGHPDCTHHCFRARADHPDQFYRRKSLPHPGGKIDLERCRTAETCPLGSGFLYGCHDLRGGMPQNNRPPGADVINVFVTIHIPA